MKILNTTVNYDVPIRFKHPQSGELVDLDSVPIVKIYKNATLVKTLTVVRLGMGLYSSTYQAPTEIGFYRLEITQTFETIQTITNSQMHVVDNIAVIL